MRARNENELIAESYHKVLNELAPIMVAAGRVAGSALANKLVDKVTNNPHGDEEAHFETGACGCGNGECGCDSHDHGGEDHDNSEIHMAKAELKKAAEYATQLSAMMDNLDGLEGWTASKITKAADYLSSVYHWLDYDHDKDQDPGMFNVGCEHSPEHQDRV
jgi:hypothetical protein